MRKPYPRCVTNLKSNVTEKALQSPTWKRTVWFMGFQALGRRCIIGLKKRSASKHSCFVLLIKSSLLKVYSSSLVVSHGFPALGRRCTIGSKKGALRNIRACINIIFDPNVVSHIFVFFLFFQMLSSGNEDFRTERHHRSHRPYTLDNMKNAKISPPSVQFTEPLWTFFLEANTEPGKYENFVSYRMCEQTSYFLPHRKMKQNKAWPRDLNKYASCSNIAQ